MAAKKGLQPLDQNTPIVDAKGTPNQYFIRLLQDRGILQKGDSDKLADLLTAFNALAAAEIIAGVALDGGGSLGAGDVTIDHADSVVTPGTYGSATKSAVITVDQQGHVTEVTEATISGGGGGGGLWYFDPPLVADFPYIASSPVTADDADTGLTLYTTTGSRFNMIGQALTAGVDWVATMHMVGTVTSTNYGNIGMGIGNAAKTGFFGWGKDGRSALHYYNYSATGFGGSEQFVNYTNELPDWLQMRYNTASGVATVHASADGKLWTPALLSYNVKAYLGADPAYIGPFANIESGVTWAGLTVDHWSIV